MLSAAVVAAGLMLGGHFEAPRDLKFQGALAPRSEIEELTRKRPSLVAPGVVLAISGGVAITGVALLVGGVTAAGWDGLAVALLGLALGAAGLVGLAISGIVMIVLATERGDLDARIELLEKRDAAPPPQPEPPPPVPSVNAAPASTLLLARF